MLHVYVVYPRECTCLNSRAHMPRTSLVFLHPSGPYYCETGSLNEQEACHLPLADKQVLSIRLLPPHPQPSHCRVTGMCSQEIQTQICMLAEPAILSNKPFPQPQVCLFVFNINKVFRQSHNDSHPPVKGPAKV